MAGMVAAGEGELTGIQEAGGPARKTPMGRALIESGLWEGRAGPRLITRAAHIGKLGGKKMEKSAMTSG